MLILIYNIYDLFFTWTLRFSHRGRVTLLQQPKRVTRKGRHASYAPVKNTGVPI